MLTIVDCLVMITNIMKPIMVAEKNVQIYYKIALVIALVVPENYN